MTELISLTAEQANNVAQKELLDLKVALDVTSIVARTDLKGTITYVNDKFCEISQYNRDELIGQNHSMLNSGVHPKSLWTEMYRVAANGQPWRYEVCNRAKDGSLYWVDTTVLGFLGQNDKLDHYIAIRTDITHQKQLELSLEQQNIELIEAKEVAEKASQLKDEFLAKMSHELRTPMHSIISFSSIGMDRFEKGTMGKLGQYFQRINQSGERLLGLLNDLLDLSSLESGMKKISFSQQEDLAEVINSCIQEQDSLITGKQLVVVKNVDSELIATIDKKLIHQLVGNLLANAIKFTPEGRKITLTAFLIHQAVNGKGNVQFPALYCLIEDEGVGIPDDDLESIFERFRESSRTKTEAGGKGLGLSICKEIIAAHNGELWASHANSGGAILHFVLPTKQGMDLNDE